MYQVGILSCWVSEEARVSRILSLGTLRIRVDLLYISSVLRSSQVDDDVI